MTEAEWVELMVSRLNGPSGFNQPGLSLQVGRKLAYGCEIRCYGPQPETQKTQSISFETDLAVIETTEDGRWKPRVVIEAKLRSVTTHDAITYSHKAASHRSVHPYLRYGIMLGNREHFPLPGRLYRHGVQFDFMISFCRTEPAESEMATFVRLLGEEVAASRKIGRAHV